METATLTGARAADCHTGKSATLLKSVRETVRKNTGGRNLLVLLLAKDKQPDDET